MTIYVDSEFARTSETILNKDLNTHLKAHKFSCLRTTFNESVLVKSTCLPFWQGEIAYKCISEPGTYDSSDALTRIPVTNVRTNITYRNIYCAICNQQEHIQLWNFNFICLEQGSSTTNTHKNIAHALDTWYLAAQDAKISPICEIEPMLPSDLEHHVQSCIPDKDAASNNIFNHYRINNINSSDFLLPRSNLCDKVTQTPLYNALCRNCTIDTFYELDTDFAYIDSEMVFICDDEHYLPKPEWRQINSTYIHVCGEPIFQQIQSLPHEKLYDGFQTYLMRQGEILIIVFLATFFYSGMKDLPKKILFSQALMLFGARVVYELDSVVPIQYLPYLLIMYHYFLLTLNCWMAISCFNVWFVICRLTNKFQRDDEMSHIKRYLFYFLICNIFIPIPIIGISVLLHFSPVNEFTCMLKMDYKKRGAHLLEKSVPYFVFNTFPIATFHIIGMTFFVVTCCYIHNSKKSAAATCSQTSNYVVLLKLTKYVLLGTLDFFVVTFIDLAFRITKNPTFFVMRWYIIKSYGTLLFLLFVFPWDKVGRLFLKYKTWWFENPPNHADTTSSRGSLISRTVLDEEMCR